MLAIGPVLGSIGAVVPAQGRATGGVSAYLPSQVQAIALTCPSPALGGTLPALVYLPAGYNGSSARYRVIYFLHGLPAGPTTYENDGFVAAAVSAAKKSAIVVAPQGARTAGGDREYLNWGPTEDWPAAISHDLVTCIDQRYRTIANRDGRALMGLSAGGYGAFNIGLRSLQTFGAVESWSGYFEATNPAGTAVLNLGSVQAQAAATVPNDSSLASQIAHYPAYVGFYVGAGDVRFLQDNKDFDQQLTTAGVAHTFAVYPGAHNSTLWRAEAPAWVGSALSYLSHAARTRRTGATGATGITASTRA
ncbi:MAG: alpha/beta hydrolase [Solirubrobacteraceae bacterium]